MPIEVELPDGNIAEFPDGTDNATMERALAQYAARPKRPDFRNSTASSQIISGATDRKRPKIPRTQAELDAATGTNLDPSAGMGRFQQARAGFGKAFADTGKGLKQTVNAAQQVKAGLEGSLLLRAGLIDRPQFQEYINRVGVPLYERGQAMQREVQNQRQTDAPLMGTGGGLVGNVAGYATQIIGPGLALRGTTAGTALLPRTIGGNALQGAGLGYVQPVASEDERGLNVGVGGVAGGAGAALPAAAVGLARTMRYGRTSGVEKRAARTLQEAMQGRALNVEQSTTPGVSRTLGEASIDPGLIAIEQNLRRSSPGSFIGIDAANNAARIRALRGIAGDESSMEAAISARDASAGPLYAAAGPMMAQVDSGLLDALSRVPPRVLAKARNIARMDGVEFGDDPTQLTGQQLHYIKLGIDDALSKAGQGGIGKVEQRALMGVKDALVSNISRAIPEYGQAMQAYSAASTPIGRMQIGQELINKMRMPKSDNLGNPRLSPAAAETALRNLGPTARKATGFNKAKPEDYLTADDFKSLSSIGDDMWRVGLRQENMAQSGSPTFEATQLSEKIAQRGVLQMAGRGAPIVGKGIKAYQEGMDKMAFDKLVFLFQNPQEAQRVLKALPPAQRSQLTQALMRLGSVSASGAAFSE